MLRPLSVISGGKVYMSRSQILSLVFGAALCIAPALLHAEATQDGQSGDMPETSSADNTPTQRPVVVDKPPTTPDGNKVPADAKTVGDANGAPKDIKETGTVTGGDATKAAAAAQEEKSPQRPAPPR